jgi:ATP-dependent Lhr-like helicase
LHDALLTAGVLTAAEVAAMPHELTTQLAAARRAGRVVIAAADGGRNGRPGTVWAAAERLPEILAVHRNAHVADPLAPPVSRAARTWSRHDALVELLRGRLTLAGPVTAATLAEPLAVAVSEAEQALLALEADGVVLRGRFTTRATRPDAPIEWCDRALLARIHRYTVNRLRAEIEPVSAADFMRFLFRWQHVEPSSRLAGLDGLREAIASLDGFELAAGAWEGSVLPSRIQGYDRSLLDSLCLSGEVAWGRLSAGSWSAVNPPRLVPATPFALFLREHANAWQALRPDSPDTEATLKPRPRMLLETLRARGASFLSDLSTACGVSHDEVLEMMGPLVASGLARSDGFSGLRAVILAAQGRPAAHHRGHVAGRWTTIAGGRANESRERAVELLAWTLLRRYGVMFRRLLARETNAPPWRDVVRVYRRLEARGEIRGGRFVAGMSGEQFALPDAVACLREVRRSPPAGELTTISTADPLNLAGIVTPGERVRAAGRNRLVYRNGVPLAVREGEFVRELVPIDPSIAASVGRALNSRLAPALR